MQILNIPLSETDLTTPSTPEWTGTPRSFSSVEAIISPAVTLEPTLTTGTAALPKLYFNGMSSSFDFLLKYLNSALLS